MGRTKKRRPNPLKDVPKPLGGGFIINDLADMAADMALRTACVRLKTREKFLLAALIPEVVALIRKGDPHITVDLRDLPTNFDGVN